MNDKLTGTQIRLGEVGQEMAYMLAEQGNARLAQEVMAKPLFGFTLSKTF